MQQYHKTQTINEKPVMPDELDTAITEYYTLMGWDPKTGVPTTAKLWQLGIPWAAEHLPAQK
jgi:aldehyde:ferredoxin oxidoreductase